MIPSGDGRRGWDGIVILLEKSRLAEGCWQVGKSDGERMTSLKKLIFVQNVGVFGSFF